MPDKIVKLREGKRKNRIYVPTQNCGLSASTVLQQDSFIKLEMLQEQTLIMAFRTAIKLKACSFYVRIVFSVCQGLGSVILAENSFYLWIKLADSWTI
jgi:hypothetical protein